MRRLLNQAAVICKALVQLTGTVTEVEDVDSKEKKLGLSLDGEEIVVLKTDDSKAYVKGELLKVKAKLIDKLIILEFSNLSRF